MSVKGRKTRRTSTYGSWSWNDELLHSKIGEEDEVGCKSWLGSKGPHAALFGASRNGKPQMTQARRVLLMSLNYPNVEESAIRMRCNNHYCMNSEHMFLEGNRRLSQPITEYVQRGYTETRIGYHRWQNLTEEQQTIIKNLASSLDAKVHFDHEFQFYSITWTTYAWFQAKLKEPKLMDLLNVVYRKVK